MTGAFATSKYKIQFDHFHGPMLEVCCQGLEKNLAHQLEEESARKKRWGGVFYKPTPGIHTIDRMAIALQDIRRSLLFKMKPACTGQLIVNEGTANLLMTAISLCYCDKH